MRQKFIGKLFAIVHGIQFVASRVCWCVCAWITVNCISNIRNIHLHWPRTHKAHSDCLFMIKNSICSVLRKLVSVFIVVAAIIVAVTIVPVVVIIVIVIVERVIVDAVRTR